MSFVHKSTIDADVLDGETSEWLSNTVVMINSVLRISEEKLIEVQGATPLDMYDRKLKDMVNLLQPFLCQQCVCVWVII